MSEIFLSYRREDSTAETQAIFLQLASVFGQNRVFKDVDSIPYGGNFEIFLRKSLKKCKVAIVVIGPRWLTVSDVNGERRLDDRKDFVRIEVETLLSRNIPIIPIAVRGASIPSRDSLPESIAELSTRMGISIPPSPTLDIGNVVFAINNILASPRSFVGGDSRFSIDNNDPVGMSIGAVYGPIVGLLLAWFVWSIIQVPGFIFLIGVLLGLIGGIFIGSRIAFNISSATLTTIGLILGFILGSILGKGIGAIFGSMLFGSTGYFIGYFIDSKPNQWHWTWKDIFNGNY